MILILCLLACAGSALAAPAGPATNLALNRPYASNVQTLPGWTGLVDGDKDSDSAPGCFGTANTSDYPKYVVIDLGGDCSISRVVAYNSANGNTKTVAIGCSADGATYKTLRDPDFIFGPGDAIPLNVSFQPRTAHYVRITLRDTWKGGLGGDNCLFLREVEVFGQRATAATRQDPFALAANQAPFVANRSVTIFRRYCLETPGEARVTVLGDGFISGCDEPVHWAHIGAAELARLYPDKKLTVNGVGGSEGSIAYGLDWAKDHRGSLAPDLIILAYGTNAALAGASADEFRGKYQELVRELVDNTKALIVAVTPLPFLPPETRSSRAHEWAVEQVAQAQDLPLLRTAAVLAKIPGDKSLLYVDSTHLSPAGHEAVGNTLADLLR